MITTPSPNTSITVVVKARNEESRISTFMKNTGWADKVVLVDDSSDDKTVEFARLHGAEVIEVRRTSEPINFLDAIGFRSVNHGWILRLDVDEIVEPTLSAAIRQEIDRAETNQIRGIAVARRNLFYGRALLHGGMFRAEYMKVFRADSWDREWDFDSPHSQVPVIGLVRRLDPVEHGAIEHTLYDSFREFRSRSLRGYATQEALALKKQSSPIWLAPVVAATVFLKVFVGRAIFRRGFRDGWRGLQWASWLALYRATVILRAAALKSRPDLIMAHVESTRYHR